MTLRGAKFEDFVAELLAKLGFTIVGKRIKIQLDGCEVGEVDILAEDSSGNKYAVEVKSGKVDITGIRQAYVNAKLLNARPLIVARGFSNMSAEKLAQELGVEVIILEDSVLLKIDELLTILESTFCKMLDELLTSLEGVIQLLEDEKLVNAISRCDDWLCVCTQLNYSESDCGKLIQEVRQRLRVSNLSLVKLKVLIKLGKLLTRLVQSQ